MRRALFLLPLLLFVVLVGYFVWSLRPSADPNLLPSALLDKPAPDFHLAGIDGGSGLALGELHGQVAVVNFFASWCAPCRVEQPLLLRLAHEGKIPLYGIDYKDDPGNAKAYLAQLGDPYRRIGADASGRTGIDFGVYGVPETYVIDKTGRIQKRIVGPLSAEIVSNELQPLVTELERK
jgi:cytochrome c biogenesis protein CcmG/thiol:disulfide interchange protein DsbE